MTLIVSATGAAAFLFSFLMLWAGLGAMGIRYALAVGLAYLVFLLLLRLWLSYTTSNESSTLSESLLDVADGLRLTPDVANTICDGGAIADAGGALSFDEFVFVLVAAAAVAAGFLVCLYVVWTAPALLAEVMVDGLVMSRILKRMNLRGGAYWASGALKRTWLPALLAVLFFGIAGFALQRVVPEADSIGPVIQSLLSRAG
ncbi:MAG: hypothetical protein KJ072_29055 [Verrucomicrobia bacterium]|nr:hypothetical protein [Verrucomicrobiota bacterium]